MENGGRTSPKERRDSERKGEQMRGSCELLPEAKCWGRDAREKERSDHWGALLDKLRNWEPFAAFLSLQPSLPKDTDPVN